MSAVTFPSLDAVREYAESIAKEFPRGAFIGFSGELGAGKTSFIREIVRALGYQGEVLSPTYTLEHVYELDDGSEIRHWDLYRLAENDECPALKELQNRDDALILIEWPEKVPAIDSVLALRFQMRNTNGVYSCVSEKLGER